MNTSSHPHSGYYVLQKKWIILYLRNFLNAWQWSYRYILLPNKHVYSLMPSLDPPTSLHSVQIVSLVHVRFCVNLSISPPHMQSRPGNWMRYVFAYGQTVTSRKRFIRIPCVVALCGNPKSLCQSLLPNSNVVSLRARLMLVLNPVPPPKGWRGPGFETRLMHAFIGASDVCKHMWALLLTEVKHYSTSNEATQSKCTNRLISIELLHRYTGIS